MLIRILNYLIHSTQGWLPHSCFSCFFRKKVWWPMLLIEKKISPWTCKQLCLHWSLQGGRHEHGFYNKTIRRIQPTKRHTLTGTFFHLEHNRSIILTRFSYLALTLLTAKAVSTIAWHTPQNCLSSLFSNVWTQFQCHLHSFCKKRKEPWQQSMSHCFPSTVMTFY